MKKRGLETAWCRRRRRTQKNVLKLLNQNIYNFMLIYLSDTAFTFGHYICVVSPTPGLIGV